MLNIVLDKFDLNFDYNKLPYKATGYTSSNDRFDLYIIFPEDERLVKKFGKFITVIKEKEDWSYGMHDDNEWLEYNKAISEALTSHFNIDTGSSSGSVSLN